MIVTNTAIHISSKITNPTERRIPMRLRKDKGIPRMYSTTASFLPHSTRLQIPYAAVMLNIPKNKKKYAFELKAPLPNSDQTKVSKEKILKLYSMEPRQVDGAFYALPYNPFGKRENYSWAFPARWFDMKNDEVVLIGNEFWEKIGGLGTYKAFIDAVNEIGKGYKDRIYREFLGIEPPITTDEGKL